MAKQNRSQSWIDSPQTTNQRETNQNTRSIPQRPTSKRKCYDYGSENHLKRNCPKNQDHKKTEVKTDQQMKHVSNAGAGLYAKCKVNNIPTQCLIDTGATLTIMSIEMWESIRPCSAPVLESYDGNVFTASGSLIEIKGKRQFLLKLMACIAHVKLWLPT